jgi:glycosyltransferase involved in cell wall biosynthesis
VALIGIVIPTHNRATELKRCLSSILEQERADELEVVVVDDGSTDETRAVVAAVEGGRVHYLRQDNAGPCSARNHGAGRVQAPFLCFLDSDDELLPGWSAAMLSLASRPGVDLVSCGVRVHETHIDRYSNFPPPPLGPAFGGHTASFVPGSYAVRREIFDLVGGFATDIGYGEHHELALRLARDGPNRLSVVSDPRPLLLKYHDRSPAVAHAYHESKLAATERTLDRHRAAIGRDKRLEANLEFVAGYCAAHLGKYKRARHHFVAATRARPLWWKPIAGYLSALIPTARRSLFERVDAGPAPGTQSEPRASGRSD